MRPLVMNYSQGEGLMQKVLSSCNKERKIVRWRIELWLEGGYE